uniref:Uncharacterized protein n=1 Tax=Hucho hucho TaxID=62062 RepID=A0A4W5NE89_9TELE
MRSALWCPTSVVCCWAPMGKYALGSACSYATDNCAAGVAASFGEMLLLVAMYFHSNQLSAIIELVCSTLGMKIAIKPSSLSKMKTIFTQEIFIEQVVTAHAVRVAVTNNLCANITGFSRAFTKHKVSIKDWNYRQLCEASSPHPAAAPHQCLHQIHPHPGPPRPTPRPPTPRPPITKQEVSFSPSLSLWQGEGGRGVRSRYSITTQLLILYYILSYEEALLANTKQLAFQKVLSSGPRLMRMLDHLTLLSAGDLIPCVEALTGSMGLLLGPGVPRRIPQTLNKLWMVLNTVMPRRLCVMTVNALQPSVKMLRQQRYTQNDLMVDPLIVLRSDQRVYRCPPLMDIVLHVLNSYLLASKAYLNSHLKEITDPL